MAPDYQFRSFGSADFAMIRQWLAMPHVVEWWGDPDEQFDTGQWRSCRTGDGS